jgi:hypothetical protein
VAELVDELGREFNAGFARDDGPVFGSGNITAVVRSAMGSPKREKLGRAHAEDARHKFDFVRQRLVAEHRAVVENDRAKLVGMAGLVIHATNLLPCFKIPS